VMEREGCSFVEACERLSTRGRPPLVDTSVRSSPKSTGRRWENLPRDSVEAQVLDLAVRVFEEQLRCDARAQSYLRRRAIPEEIARIQRLGYADGHALLDCLKQKAHPELLPAAVQLGLVLERPGA